MNHAQLAAVFHASPLLPVGVPPADAAVAILPAVVDGMPPVATNGDGRGSILSACTAALRVPVERVVRGVLDEALVDLAPVQGDELAERLRTDPLVALLARLVAEGGAVSRPASVLPLLDTVRISAACFGNPSALVADAVAKALALEPAKRGVVLARVAAGMQQRVGAATLAAAEQGVSQPGLAAALLGSRLSWVFPEGSLDAHPDVPLVAAMLGAPIPPANATAVGRAIEAAARAVLGRRAANRATPDDHALALRFLPPSAATDPALAAKALALDPDAVGWILPALPRWVSVRELTSAGIEKAVASKLLSPATAVALASTVTDALRAMRTWAVLSQVTASVVPVDPAVDGTAVVLAPRPLPTQATVIAVGLGRGRATPGGSSALVPAVGQAFAECMAAFPGVAHADFGPIGLAVAADVRVAARAAFALRERLGEGRSRPAVAMATGQVAGGSDGDTLKIAGPAVSGALRLLAHDEMVARPFGLSGALGLAVVDGLLCGDGLAVDRSTGGALVRAGLREVRSPRAPRGVEIDRAFEWEDRILALAPIGGMAGALELLALARADWDALHSDDAPAPVPGTRRLQDRRSLAERLSESEDASDVATAPPANPEAPYGGLHRADVYFESSDGPAPPTPSPATVVTVSPGEPAEGGDLFAGAPEFMLAGPGTSVAAPAPASEPVPSEFGLPTDGDPFAAAGAVPGAADYAPAETPGFSGPSTVVDHFGEAEPAARAGEPAPPAAPEADVAWPPPEFTAPETSAPPPPEPAEVAQSAPAPVATPLAWSFDDPVPEPPAPSPPPAPVEIAPPPPAPEPQAPYQEPFAAPPRAEPAASRYDMAIEDDEDEASANNARTLRAPAPAASAAPADPWSQPAPAATPPAELSPPPPPPPPAPPPAPPKGPAPEAPQLGRRRPPPTVDFGYLLRGYACFLDRGDVVFGRPYGARMVDRHSYPSAGDLDAAYRSFLQDKIKEGFLPQTELTGELPRGVTLLPLESDRLDRAWANFS